MTTLDTLYTRNGSKFQKVDRPKCSDCIYAQPLYKRSGLGQYIPTGTLYCSLKPDGVNDFREMLYINSGISTDVCGNFTPIEPEAVKPIWVRVQAQ